MKMMTDDHVSFHDSLQGLMAAVGKTDAVLETVSHVGHDEWRSQEMDSEHPATITIGDLNDSCREAYIAINKLRLLTLAYAAQ